LKSEQLVQTEIRAGLAETCLVFRANVGKVKTIDGRWFDTGLPKGFPDIFGFRKSDGKFFAIEVKNEKGRLRPDQIKFGEFLKSQPVLYGVARSAEDALKIVLEEKNID